MTRWGACTATVAPAAGAYGAAPPVTAPTPDRLTFGSLWRGERLAPLVATLLALPVVISTWNSYAYAGSTTAALAAAWLTALALTCVRPGLAGAFAAVAPATLLLVRDDMPGTEILALPAAAACTALAAVRHPRRRGEG
ncbi:hypothetical protein ACFZAU_04770 [Streptomyces sp. NPDC008238]